MKHMFAKNIIQNTLFFYYYRKQTLFCRPWTCNGSSGSDVGCEMMAAMTCVLITGVLRREEEEEAADSDLSLRGGHSKWQIGDD